MSPTARHLWADHFDGAARGRVRAPGPASPRASSARWCRPCAQAEIERARRKPPASLDAYDYVLRPCRWCWPIRWPRPDAGREAAGARRCGCDPDYAYAHALIAHVYGQVFRSAIGPAREEARSAGGRARPGGRPAAAPDDSAALAYGRVHPAIADKDVAGARAALDRAVARNPNSAHALHLPGARPGASRASPSRRSRTRALACA